jgi:hypothetical protein
MDSRDDQGGGGPVLLPFGEDAGSGWELEIPAAVVRRAASRGGRLVVRVEGTTVTTTIVSGELPAPSLLRLG